MGRTKEICTGSSWNITVRCRCCTIRAMPVHFFTGGRGLARQQMVEKRAESFPEISGSCCQEFTLDISPGRNTTKISAGFERTRKHKVKIGRASCRERGKI